MFRWRSESNAGASWPARERIVCFDVAGMSAEATVRRLGKRGIVATVTPYATTHVRLAPSIVNTPDEVDAAIAAVREIAA